MEILPEAAENLAGSENGCYVDGHWGQYAMAHMVTQFSGTVYQLSSAEEILVRRCSADYQLEPDEDLHEQLVALADEAENAINGALADGRVAHWHDGEFFLSPYCGGEEECADETCACHG